MMMASSDAPLSCVATTRTLRKNARYFCSCILLVKFIYSFLSVSLSFPFFFFLTGVPEANVEGAEAGAGAAAAEDGA